MRNFFESLRTATTGIVGMSATAGGFYVSILPMVEAWLRVASLVIGIAVGVASLISIIRNQRNKKTPMKKPHIRLFTLVLFLSAAASAVAQGSDETAANSSTLNWQTITSLIVAVVLVARIIVKLTPTPKDDTVLDKVITFLKHVGLHIDSSETK